MKEISRLEIKPLRIAFDHADADNVKIYVAAQRLAAKYSNKTLSNYILFNFEDSPEELYIRLCINIELNEEFRRNGYETSIWSFPMKYMPISGQNSHDRKYIGAQWTKKQLRGIQCILNATHAVVGPKRSYFEHAFGKNEEEYHCLIYMPEHMIINRTECEQNGKIDRWTELYTILSEEDKNSFLELVKDNDFKQQKISNPNINELYNMYL